MSSADKTFSCRGWKIGWVTGPASLISTALRVKQFLTFVNGAPLEPAVAVALGLPDRLLHRLPGRSPVPPGPPRRRSDRRGLRRAHDGDGDSLSCIQHAGALRSRPAAKSTSSPR